MCTNLLCRYYQENDTHQHDGQHPLGRHIWQHTHQWRCPERTAVYFHLSSALFCYSEALLLQRTNRSGLCTARNALRDMMSRNKMSRFNQNCDLTRILILFMRGCGVRILFFSICACAISGLISLLLSLDGCDTASHSNHIAAPRQRRETP